MEWLMLRALALSIIPSVIFLFSGIMSRSILLFLASVPFAPAHILISCKSADLEHKNQIFRFTSK